jgi:hypothetical protein
MNARLSELHSATRDRIEHPGRDPDDVSRLDFDVNDSA